MVRSFWSTGVITFFSFSRYEFITSLKQQHRWNFTVKYCCQQNFFISSQFKIVLRERSLILLMCLFLQRIVRQQIPLYGHSKNSWFFPTCKKKILFTCLKVKVSQLIIANRNTHYFGHCKETFPFGVFIKLLLSNFPLMMHLPLHSVMPIPSFASASKSHVDVSAQAKCWGSKAEQLTTATTNNMGFEKQN